MKMRLEFSVTNLDASADEVDALVDTLWQGVKDAHPSADIAAASSPDDEDGSPDPSAERDELSRLLDESYDREKALEATAARVRAVVEVVEKAATSPRYEPVKGWLDAIAGDFRVALDGTPTCLCPAGDAEEHYRHPTACPA